MGQIGNAITGVLSAGPVGLIMKGVVLLGGFFLFMYLKHWYNNYLIEKARAAEEAKRVEDKQKEIADNKKQNDQAASDSHAVDDFLGKK